MKDVKVLAGNLEQYFEQSDIGNKEYEVVSVINENAEWLAVSCEYMANDLIQYLDSYGFELHSFESDGRESVYVEFVRQNE